MIIPRMYAAAEEMWRIATVLGVKMLQLQLTWRHDHHHPPEEGDEKLH